MVSNDDTSHDTSCEILCKIGICAISRGNNMATKNRIANIIRRIRIIGTLEAKSSKRKSLEQEKLERVGIIATGFAVVQKPAKSTLLKHRNTA